MTVVKLDHVLDGSLRHSRAKWALSFFFQDYDTYQARNGFTSWCSCPLLSLFHQDPEDLFLSF